MTKKDYWYWLCNIPGFGARKLKKLLDFYEGPEQLFYVKGKELGAFERIREKDMENWDKSKKTVGKLLEQYHNLKAENIKFVTLDEAEYPEKLKKIYDPPIGLYIKGKLPFDDRPTVAIVGSRACTAYGKETARHFGYELADAGVQIVSGMAVGIDGSGQLGALEAGGDTYAILGSGVNVCYPMENIDLYMEIQKKGGVISELPPDKKGLPYHFPMRNRIISGISDCVLVVEARKKSGSLITVDQALEQGKEVFAVPGRIQDALSSGCNELIKNGAGIAVCPQDVLEFFHITIAKENREYKKIGLNPKEEYILQFIGAEEIHLEDILQKSKMTVGDLMTGLLQLELKGYVLQPIKNYYIQRE